MKNITQLLVLFLAVSITAFAQEKGIYLINKKTKDSVFIKENLRTKVVTIDKFVMIGKLKIIDDKTINIDGIDIPVETVFKIRRASLFHAIADPIAIVVGPVLTLVGFVAVGITPGVEPVLILLAGLPGLAISIIPIYRKDNHINESWDYSIKN